MSDKDVGLYRRYLNEYVQEALRFSDGTNAGIIAYLREKRLASGLLVRHKEVKNRALHEARVAFEEHRHWPVEIVLSHLGVEKEG